MIYKKLIKPLLFRFDAEKIHDATIKLLSLKIIDEFIRPFFSFENNVLNVKAGKLNFRNPIGLAAGMDKNCEAAESWDAIGFGFAEVGTVTPLPQQGNPKPRIFRLENHHGIINRLGFNNIGADEFRKNLIRARESISPDFILGVNIGKNSTTELKNAIDDYTFLFETLYEHADYFAINVSSPNTENLRQLQHKQYLSSILYSLQQLNVKLDSIFSCQSKDIYLKIAPDLTISELDDIAEVCIENKITGIIATNTTISRDMLPEDVVYEQGGLSGKPLTSASDEIIGYIKKYSGDRLSIIGCGGIFDLEDVKRKLELGASLVQIYTGLVYNGPFMIKEIKKKLFEKLTSEKVD